MNKAITFLSFGSADVSRSGEGMHGIRVSLLTDALTVAFGSGNRTQLIQAEAVFATAKGKKAQAYREGMTAIGQIVPVTYPGKLSDAGNKEARETVARLAQEAAQRFSDAFVAVLPLTKAEKTDAEKEAAKAEKAAKEEKAHKEWADANGYAVARPLSASELTDAVCAAIASGQLSADMLDQLNKAVKAALGIGAKKGKKEAATV